MKDKPRSQSPLSLPGKVLNAWPLVRQITQRDPLGLGKAVQSKRSAQLRPRIGS